MPCWSRLQDCCAVEGATLLRERVCGKGAGEGNTGLCWGKEGNNALLKTSHVYFAGEEGEEDCFAEEHQNMLCRGRGVGRVVGGRMLCWGRRYLHTTQVLPVFQLAGIYINYTWPAILQLLQ